MKLKNQIELLNNTLKLHDEKVDEHFPKDESKVTAYGKAQYMNLFSVIQEIVKAYEFTTRRHKDKASVKAIEILVTNINEHSEMLNEILEDTDYENWTKEEDEHYTVVFYYDLHRTIEETIEEMKEV